MKTISPRVQRKLKEFINKHFDVQIRESYSSTEHRFQCPFCKGGSTGDVSFDMNVTKGVARCWRATCGWKGSYISFLMDFLDISFEEACIELDAEGIRPEDIAHLERILQDRWDIDLSSSKFYVEPKYPVDFEDLHQSLKYEIEMWITSRGWDPSEFLELFPFTWDSTTPDYVCFNVECGGNTAYLRYGFRNINKKFKTLNPDRPVLSKMLFGFDNGRHDKDVFFICEGFFDKAKIESYGLSCGCIFTTHISLQQAIYASQVDAKEICVVMDNGALEKAEKIARMIAKFVDGRYISVMDIPDQGEDPDSLSYDRFMDLFDLRRIYVKSKRKVAQVKFDESKYSF